MKRSSGAKGRRGGALIITLACLVILGVLQALVIQSVVAERRLAREHAQRHQARWLAEAGIQRAAAALAVSNAYRGENWQLSAAQGGDNGLTQAGAVEIEVLPAATATDRLVRVKAAYPADPPKRVVYQKQIVISLTPRG